MVKECEEEASIPAALAATAKAVGVVSYLSQNEAGLKPDVLFCYDIQLPADFVPRPCDGEVDEFFRWPVQRVADVVAQSRDYKDNCTLVIIDFLIRHGFVTPDMQGYVELCRALRAGS